MFLSAVGKLTGNTRRCSWDLDGFQGVKYPLAMHYVSQLSPSCGENQQHLPAACGGISPLRLWDNQKHGPGGPFKYNV